MSGVPTPSRSSVVSSTAATFLVNVLGAGMSLASVLVVSRVLGPTGRGEVVFLMAMTTLTSAFALVGMPDANVNFASAEPNTRASLATNSLALSLLAGWTVALIVFAIAAAQPGF